MVTKTALKMLEGAVMTGVTVSGVTATFTMSDGTTRTMQLGTEGAITGVTAAMVIAALGYTPLNKAGDTVLGRLLVSAGTAQYPSLTFADDLAQDSGFFHLGDGKIGVSLDGVHQITFGTPTGGITANGNISGLSDASVKTNIEQIANPMSIIRNLMGVTYERTDILNQPRETGLVAQNVLQYHPEAVRAREDGKLVVAYGNLVGLAFEGLKEVDGTVSEMKAEIKTLREGLDSAMKIIAELQAARNGG